MKADLESQLKQGSWVKQINWVPESLLLISTAVAAGGIHLLYGYIQQLSRELFFTTASDEFLPWHAQLWDRPKLPAVKATGELRFTGTDTTTIPSGTQVQTENGTIYVTNESGEITGGQIDIEITAAISGTSGNVETETMELVSPIIGVDSIATVLVQPNGGVDQETNSALVARLLQRTRNPPGSGNKGDYQRWALSVPGVGRVWVRGADEWLGAGTVGVIVASDVLEILDSSTHDAVADYIESVRPLGADVDVVDPLPSDCGFSISISPNTESIRSAITSKLREIFIVDANPGGTMLLTHINKAISSTAVDNFEIDEIRKNGTPITLGDITSTGLELLRFDETDIYYSGL
jgi:uncharacterized phage protein gp47/JayE